MGSLIKRIRRAKPYDTWPAMDSSPGSAWGKLVLCWLSLAWCLYFTVPPSGAMVRDAGGVVLFLGEE